MFGVNGCTYTRVHVCSVLSLSHTQFTPFESCLHTDSTVDCIIVFYFPWSLYPYALYISKDKVHPLIIRVNVSIWGFRTLLKGALAEFWRVLAPFCATKTPLRFYPWTKKPPLPTPVSYRLRYHHSHHIGICQDINTQTKVHKFMSSTFCFIYVLNAPPAVVSFLNIIMNILLHLSLDLA